MQQKYKVPSMHAPDQDKHSQVRKGTRPSTYVTVLQRAVCVMQQRAPHPKMQQQTHGHA
jgi:hypothetical protein